MMVMIVIFILQEFDSLALSRGGTDDGTQTRRLLSEILLQLNQLKSSRLMKSDYNVAVIAATNRVEDLDEAIIRRFDVKIFCSLPDLQSRLALITKFMIGIDTNIDDYEKQNIAMKTVGWSACDIEVC